MKNELRVNNIVNRKFLNPSPTGLQTCFTDCKIKAIGIEKIIYECKDKSLTKVDFDRVYPIPLTEEWLLKFGFKKDKNFYDNETRLSLWTDEKFNGFLADWADKTIGEIKYVHQLQNLYFALTNKEL